MWIVDVQKKIWPGRKYAQVMMLIGGCRTWHTVLEQRAGGTGGQKASLICQVLFFRENGWGAITANRPRLLALGGGNMVLGTQNATFLDNFYIPQDKKLG